MLEFTRRYSTAYLLPCCCCCGGEILMKSSIRRIVTAASVAKRRDLTFEIAGSTTPAFRLLTTCRGRRGSGGDAGELVSTQNHSHKSARHDRGRGVSTKLERGFRAAPCGSGLKGVE